MAAAKRSEDGRASPDVPVQGRSDQGDRGRHEERRRRRRRGEHLLRWQPRHRQPAQEVGAVEKMKNHLFRDRAPITEAGWEEIEKEATRTLRTLLAARRVVDF